MLIRIYSILLVLASLMIILNLSSSQVYAEIYCSNEADCDVVPLAPENVCAGYDREAKKNICVIQNSIPDGSPCRSSAKNGCKNGSYCGSLDKLTDGVTSCVKIGGLKPGDLCHSNGANPACSSGTCTNNKCTGCGDGIKQPAEVCDTALKYTTNTLGWAPNQTGGYNSVSYCTGNTISLIQKCKLTCDGYETDTTQTNNWKDRCYIGCGGEAACSGALPGACSDDNSFSCSDACKKVTPANASCTEDDAAPPEDDEEEDDEQEPAVGTPKIPGATNTPTSSPTPEPPGASSITAFNVYCHPFVAGRKQFDLTFSKVADATSYLVTFGGHAFYTGAFTGSGTTMTITGLLEPATFPAGESYEAKVETYNAAGGKNSSSITRNVGASCGTAAPTATPTLKPGDPTYTPTPTLKPGDPTYTPTPTTQPVILGCPDIPQSGYRNTCQTTACVAPATQYNGANGNEACTNTHGNNTTPMFCCKSVDASTPVYPKTCSGGSNTECTGYGSFCNQTTKQCSTPCVSTGGYVMRCGNSPQAGETVYGSATHNDCRAGNNPNGSVCYYKPIEDTSNPTNTPTPTSTSNQSGATHTPTPTVTTTQTDPTNTPTPSPTLTTTNPNAASCTGANAGKNNCPCDTDAQCANSANDKCNTNKTSKPYNFCY